MMHTALTLALGLTLPGLALAVDADRDGFDDTVDCNDRDASIFPGAPEVTADGVDQNCDGQELCFTDLDGDRYGQPNRVLSFDLSCSRPGLSDNSDDCDDSDFSVNPGATEIPADGVDSNCDGMEQCFSDLDGDGFGSPRLVLVTGLSCSRGPGVSDTSDDCDDTNARINPNAVDIPGNGIDEDCDGLDAVPVPVLIADAISMTCPASTGPSAVTWTGATSSGPVLVLVGPPMIVSVPVGPCLGTEIGVLPTGATVFPASSNVRGNGFFTGNFARTRCSDEIVVLDLTTCEVSSPIGWR